VAAGAGSGGVGNSGGSGVGFGGFKASADAPGRCVQYRRCVARPRDDRKFLPQCWHGKSLVVGACGASVRERCAGGAAISGSRRDAAGVAGAPELMRVCGLEMSLKHIHDAIQKADLEDAEAMKRYAASKEYAPFSPGSPWAMPNLSEVHLRDHDLPQLVEGRRLVTHLRIDIAGPEFLGDDDTGAEGSANPDAASEVDDVVHGDPPSRSPTDLAALFPNLRVLEIRSGGSLCASLVPLLPPGLEVLGIYGAVACPDVRSFLQQALTAAAPAAPPLKSARATGNMASIPKVLDAMCFVPYAATLEELSFEGVAVTNAASAVSQLPHLTSFSLVAGTHCGDSPRLESSSHGEHRNTHTHTVVGIAWCQYTTQSLA
jgi:hypothetical protein